MAGTRKTKIINKEKNMEKRRFGRTGHMSTVAIFGAAAFWEISQADADKVMEQVIEAGINHIDIAPSYGQAEERVGPWMPRERDRFFLGCKTMERTRQGAWDEMRGRSNDFKLSPSTCTNATPSQRWKSWIQSR